MRKEVTITLEESNEIYRLYSTHVSYMNMLQYLMNNGMSEHPTYDKKWNEAIELDRQLTKAKQDIEKKYKPEGNWDRFEFDFDKYTVVFIKDDA